jgi:hypothetical protein
MLPEERRGVTQNAVTRSEKLQATRHSQKKKKGPPILPPTHARIHLFLMCLCVFD